jgi:hypothetical protein
MDRWVGWLVGLSLTINVVALAVTGYAVWRGVHDVGALAECQEQYRAALASLQTALDVRAQELALLEATRATLPTPVWCTENH